MNLVAYVAKLRNLKVLSKESQANKRGSEAHWNPESKTRVKNVRMAMLELRKKRKENARDAGFNPDSDELTKSLANMQSKQASDRAHRSETNGSSKSKIN